MNGTWCAVTGARGASEVRAVLNLGAGRCAVGARCPAHLGARGAGGLIPPHAREGRSADPNSEQRGAPK